MKKIRLLLSFCITMALVGNTLYSQEIKNDSIKSGQNDSVNIQNHNSYSFSYKKLIIPGILISYGVASLNISALKQLNLSTRHEIYEHQPYKMKLDNYTQYTPAVLVYGLNLAGIKGKHNLKDLTIIYASSQLISAAFVVPLKHLTKIERPDGSNFQSFPSGHAATAFSTAHFMFREYKEDHFWLSLAGYPFALFTGIYRAINNKHWVGDIVAGAGFGILSTELAYWLYPKINNLLFKNNKNTTTIIAPFFQNNAFGLGLVKNF